MRAKPNKIPIDSKNNRVKHFDINDIIYEIGLKMERKNNEKKALRLTTIIPVDSFVHEASRKKFLQNATPH